MVRAQLAHAPKIAGGRNDHARLTLHGLDEEADDGGVLGEEPLERLGVAVGDAHEPRRVGPEAAAGVGVV